MIQGIIWRWRLLTVSMATNKRNGIYVLSVGAWWADLLFTPRMARGRQRFCGKPLSRSDVAELTGEQKCRNKVQYKDYGSAHSSALLQSKKTRVKLWEYRCQVCRL